MADNILDIADGFRKSLLAKERAAAVRLVDTYGQIWSRLFQQLNEESGITVIIVTHDQDVARSAKRVIVLRDGVVVEDTADFARAMHALHSGDLAASAE